MKLSEYKNEDALELLADILDPLSDIMTDEEFKRILQEESTKKSINKMAIIQYLLKNQSKQIIRILAIIDGTPVEDFEVNILSLTQKLLDVFNDKEMVDFFKSQGQMLAGETSGSVTENTEATEET